MRDTTDPLLAPPPFPDGDSRDARGHELQADLPVPLVPVAAHGDLPPDGLVPGVYMLRGVFQRNYNNSARPPHVDTFTW